MDTVASHNIHSNLLGQHSFRTVTVYITLCTASILALVYTRQSYSWSIVIIKKKKLESSALSLKWFFSYAEFLLKRCSAMLLNNILLYVWSQLVSRTRLLVITYLLTAWCRVLLEKLTGLQLVKFPAFHGTPRFITALTSVRHLSLSWANPIQSIYPHPTLWRPILILSTHLRLGLPSGLLPSGFPTKTLYTPLSNLLTYLLAYLLTYSMVQSPSWETNWFAASQIPRISRNSKVHYRNHKRPPTVPILGQPNPVHIPTSHLLEIHPNIIHPSTPRSPQWSLCSVWDLMDIV